MTIRRGAHRASTAAHVDRTGPQQQHRAWGEKGSSHLSIRPPTPPPRPSCPSSRPLATGDVATSAASSSTALSHLARMKRRVVVQEETGKVSLHVDVHRFRHFEARRLYLVTPRRLSRAPRWGGRVFPVVVLVCRCGDASRLRTSGKTKKKMTTAYMRWFGLSRVHATKQRWVSSSDVHAARKATSRGGKQ